jgi:hypothetical protein
MESIGLEELRCSIAQPGSAVDALVPGRIFPEAAHFVDDRHPVSATGTDRRQRVEDRRVGMQNFRPHLADYVVEPSAQIGDDLQLAQPWQSGDNTGRHRRA